MAEAAQGLVGIGDQHRELVAAETGREVLLAEAVAEPFGHRDQDRVAGVVADRVVDRLEVVEVAAGGRR